MPESISEPKSQGGNSGPEGESTRFQVPRLVMFPREQGGGELGLITGFGNIKKISSVIFGSPS